MTNAALHVLFLDIDGVLLPFGSDDVASFPQDRLFPDETLAALTTILTELPTAVLVLSSTWRVRHDFCHDIMASLQSYGKQYGGPLAKLQDFYDVTDRYLHSERQWEIHAWLSSHSPVRAWVALDDEELVEGECNTRYRSHFVGHVVKTDSAIGLTDKDAQQALELMKQQIAQADR